MPKTPEGVQLVYRPKDDAERARIIQRTKQMVGSPFIKLPSEPPQHKVLFISKCGNKIKVEHVEIVYNDAMLCDAISDYGKDGPLYKDTIEGLQLEVYNYAIEAYGKRGMN